MAGRIETEAFRLINSERRKRGLGPLVWDEELHRGTYRHSRDMFGKGKLFHSFSQDFAECIYGGRGNLHPSACTARGIVHSWLTSKAGHREILLGRFKKGAVGVYGQKGKGFFATFRCRTGFWQQILG
jgi:uncharacterized protein YkwD